VSPQLLARDLGTELGGAGRAWRTGRYRKLRLS